MRRTAVFRHELFLQHIPDFDHVESPQRLEVIYRQLDRPEVGANFIYPAFEPASEDILRLNHTARHVERIAATDGKSFSVLDPDTMASPHSYAAAILAAGAVVRGVEMLASGEADNGFALIRPPGHHAEADAAMGFCLFNNVAIGARHAIKHLGMKRVLIVDWDLHHGNGTQHAFYDTDQVFYFSTHQYPYYPGSGGLAETGTGAGLGCTINVPLSSGQGDAAYGRIFREITVPLIRQYRPELILVSAGFDIYAGDPLGGMAVSPAGFAYMTRMLLAAAAEVCNGRLLVVLEGGYNLAGLRDGVLAVLGELADITDSPEARLNRLSPEAIKDIEQRQVLLPVIDKVRVAASKYWSL